eukprot:CAMPEP_0119407104 /NCGR_PEP_ID=MMETSP1335-20130426/1148_1 /TAXON_ID=259385 /ORGANISM="Chrysoculter rhomboideus, Strain RCC1486" /LENGTH=200 /DNA_ID=CAMNT_0007431197 /DNA_START=39 /DNA_END=641 /DNA_ORIENTATION=+
MKSTLALALLVAVHIGSLSGVNAFVAARMHSPGLSHSRFGRLLMADSHDRAVATGQVRIPATPEIAAVAARRDMKQQTEQRRPLIKINVSGMSQGEILQIKIALGALALIAIRAIFGRKGPSGPTTSHTEYTAQTEEAQSELKAFKCENCGYELYPARGREGKFFPSSFKCPMCGSPKESFYDMNDKNDPRNWEEEEGEL